jgi:hypothetical protein
LYKVNDDQIIFTYQDYIHEPFKNILIIKTLRVILFYQIKRKSIADKFQYDNLG